MKKRLAIFRSACCVGWAYAYEANDRTQQMIRKHSESYNSARSWGKRNCDGNVLIYDDAFEALAKVPEDAGLCDEESFPSLDSLLSFFGSDGDGMEVDAAWIVHLLLYDALADDWSVHNFAEHR